MYSKQPSNKGYKQNADVNVGNDKGSLRLQFSTKVSEKFYGKRQAYKGLGRKDNPENRTWADGIARRMQADIDHPDGNLFDPSLAKYLDIKPMLATVTQLPTAMPLPTLGELWDEFVERKLRNKEIRNTTYVRNYKANFEPMIKEFFSKPLNEDNANQLINSLTNRTKNLDNVKSLLGILSQMCQRAMAKKMLTEDYFKEISESFKVPEKSNQLKDEEDYRAYNAQERDLIISAFRQHQKLRIRKLADFIEFSFLTGFRPSEAIALSWNAVKFNTGWIYVNETFDSRTKERVHNTKTGKYRIFKMKGMNRLINLLQKLYGDRVRASQLGLT